MRACSSVNQSVLAVTVSPRNMRKMISSASIMRSRWVIGSMPSIIASEVRSPGAGAEHDPAHPRFREGHVVELDDAVRDHQRVVVRHRHDTGAELDPPRLRSSRPRSCRARYYPKARDIA
jgi:hypothetical protein